MAYDPYDAPSRDHGSRRYYREDRRDDRDDYLRVYPSSRDLIPRPRENSDLSVEEVRRDFPPPGYAHDGRGARSMEPGYYDDYDDRRSNYSRGHDRDHHRSHRTAGSVYYEEEEKKRARMLGKQEKIIAAIAGAALAVGGKEIYDRREANQEGSEIHRNALTSAALGAAGALAGYQGAEFYNKHASKEEKKSTYIVHKGRDGRMAEYYSDEEEEDGKDKKGHKNFLESALAAAGLGGAVKALTGGHHDDRRSDTRSRHGSDTSRGGSKGEGSNKIQKAAMASLIAGATEAFRVSKEPGSWRGEKAKRILTAAAGAATIDAAHGDGHSKLALAESVIGGLVGNRVLNGSKKNIEEDEKTGRSRSRSRARSRGGGGGSGATGLAALATAGLGAFGAKKLMDNREKSRERRQSADSYGSRDGSPDRRRRSRSRSIVDTARRSLAKIGIGKEADDRSRSRSRDAGRRHGRHGSDDGYDDQRGHGRGGRDEYDDDRSYKGRDRSRSRSQGPGAGRRGGGEKSGSESDLGDSDEDEKRAKKMRGKQILTTGLAAVATIHAAHNVYQSMEKRNARHKAVKEGRLSPEEAKKLKTKALLQDAASVGIAALGIKGALSELKEARELSHECKEWQEKKVQRHERRLERQKHQKQITNGSEGRSRDDDDWSPSRSDRYYDDGPRYYDGNPYSAALPAPPVGYSDRR